jgi:hypothetical protein
MNRIITLLSLGLVLFSAKFAEADAYSDCLEDCTRAQTQCVESITLYDATGVQEATQACASAQVACAKRCHDEEDLGKEGYQLRLQKEAEEAEQRRQQEQQESDGGLRVLRPGE